MLTVAFKAKEAIIKFRARDVSDVTVLLITPPKPESAIAPIIPVTLNTTEKIANS